MNQMRRRLGRAAVTTAALAAIGVSLVGCGGGSGGGTAATQAPKTGATQVAGGGAAAVSELTVVGKDNVFEPKVFTISAGKAVTVTFKNEGSAVHNLSVLSDEAGTHATDVAVNAGETSKFTMTLNKKGTVKFICVYHQPDMSGSITVQ